MAMTLEEFEALPAMLTLKDMERYFGVSRETVRKMAKRPGFPLFCNERLRRIPKAKFMQWLDEQTGQDPAKG